MRRKTIRYLVIYIIVMIIFGLIYWKIAENTRGEAFLYNDNMKIREMNEAFMKSIDVGGIPDELFFRLIDESVYYNRKQVRFYYREEDPFKSINAMTRLSDSEAEFYERLLVGRENISHFRIDKITKDETFIGLNKVLIKYYTKIDLEAAEIESENYKLSDSFEEVKEEWILLDQFPEVHQIVIQVSNEFIPVDRILREYYRMSLITPGMETVLNLRLIENGQYKYNPLDFIYFSLVTITTLGFGDILPNSTFVRGLVTIETIAGLILIGCVVSSIFQNETVYTDKVDDTIELYPHIEKDI